MAGGIGPEGGQIDDREVRDVGREVGAVRADQEVADEQRVPGVLGVQPSPHPMARIGPAVEVLGEKLLALGVVQEVGEELLEGARDESAVVVPPDLRLAVGVAHDELVLRRAAGVNPRLGEEGSAMGETGLAADEGMLVERGRLLVPVNRLEVAKAERLGAVGAVVNA